MIVIICIDHISKHSPGRYLHETLFLNTETNSNDITLSRFPSLRSRICGSLGMILELEVLIGLERGFRRNYFGRWNRMWIENHAGN